MVVTKDTADSTTSAPLAVIDIGSTAIRMMIGQITEKGHLKVLEFLNQAIILGKDTFTKGLISQSSIDQCIKVLKSFRKMLDEYQIKEIKHVRTIVTTAVREAENRDAFIDRISIATGLRIEIIEDHDCARFTFLSFSIHINPHKNILNSTIIMSEISGGSSFLLHVSHGNVTYLNSFGIGTLRTIEMLEVSGTSYAMKNQLIKTHINNMVERIVDGAIDYSIDHLICLGSDIVFAASKLLPKWDHASIYFVSVYQLARFTDHIMSLSVNELMKKYNLSFTDAESVGPALLFYVSLAQSLKLKKILLTPVSMRHGILLEMAGMNIQSLKLQNQIMLSALATGKKYNFYEAHALQVAKFCSFIFKTLEKEHRFEPWWEQLLLVAAYLHDIGLYINSRNHHKHSMYLIQNSEIFGIDSKDLLLVSLIARYHRRSKPKAAHQYFNYLDLRNRLCVTKMSAILRVADCLDRSNTQKLTDIACSIKDDTFIISVQFQADLSIEQMALQNKGDLFTDVFGLKLVLRNNP